MNFLALQDAVMGRLNLTSNEARTRIKQYINERNRKLATSIGLSQVRRTQQTLNTINNTYEYALTTVVKVITVTYPGGNRILGALTMDQIRNMDPDNGQRRAPEVYAVSKFNADGVTLYLWPKPDAVYALQIDGLARGTDLSASGDIPAFPEDFHDHLVFAATADELEKMEKPEQAAGFERRAAQRASDLRYFLAKDSYLHLQQNDSWWATPAGWDVYGWW